MTKYNHHTESKGLCKSCGKTGQQHFIATKGKRKGEKFIDHSAYYKVFEQVNWFRGDDEYLGTWCKDCFKAKKYCPADKKESRKMEMGLAAQANTFSPAGYNPPSITARLKQQKEVLEQQLTKVNEALSVLEGNPELQKAVEAISMVENY